MERDLTELHKSIVELTNLTHQGTTDLQGEAGCSTLGSYTKRWEDLVTKYSQTDTMPFKDECNVKNCRDEHNHNAETCFKIKKLHDDLAFQLRSEGFDAPYLQIYGFTPDVFSIDRSRFSQLILVVDDEESGTQT